VVWGRFPSDTRTLLWRLAPVLGCLSILFSQDVYMSHPDTGDPGRARLEAPSFHHEIGGLSAGGDVAPLSE
jgi:hypothetical protein